MSAQESSVAVVGGGLGGLAAACVAAARGHKVTLYDKNSWIGGKAAVLHEGGFRFDMGPTILTVPRVLERIFAEAGRNLSDYLDLVRLDPQWRCFFDDGTQHRPAGEHRRDGRGHGPLRSRQAYRRGLPALPGNLRPSARHLEPVLLLEAGGGSLRHHQHPRQHESRRPCGTCCPCAWDRRSPAPSAPRSRTSASRRCSTTSRNMSARRPTALRPCSAPSPTCRRRTASGIRWAARAPWRRPWRSSRPSSASPSGPTRDVTSLRIENGAVEGLVLAEWRE